MTQSQNLVGYICLMTLILVYGFETERSGWRRLQTREEGSFADPLRNVLHCMIWLKISDNKVK